MQPPKHHILAVDDDEKSLLATAHLLTEAGYEVDSASSPSMALDFLKSGKRYTLAVVDYAMPEMTGAQLISEIKKHNEDTCALILSGDESREALKAAYAAGAKDFIEKFQDPEVILTKIAHYVGQAEGCRTLTKECEEACDGIDDPIKTIGMVGSSKALKDAALRVLLYRQHKEPVLIIGESGTGKELIARALHVGENNRFFAINCAAYAGNAHLLESELYGYEKGAFTGANQRKVGIFEIARGGTIFLDELHQLPLEGQAKLLRALQEKKLRRMGGAEEHAVEFRLIAAVKPDIICMMKDKEFLQDLYYRVHTLWIDIPALRDRPEDIAPLVALFAERYNKKYNTQKSFQMGAIKFLMTLPWMGNVRELESAVVKILADAKSDVVTEASLRRCKDLQQSDVQETDLSWAEMDARHAAERRSLIEKALNGSRNVSVASRRLGIRRQTLVDVMKRMGIVG